MVYVVLFIYGLALVLITLFSLGQLHLTWLYLKAKKQKQKTANTLPETLPIVTIQLPVYNEKYVVERLLNAVTAITYPKEKLEIQVLDDSTDETLSMVHTKVEQLVAQGYNIEQVRRPNRKGFKAGALQYGLEHCKGEFIAIFDADFLPSPDFLIKTIPGFANKNVGLIQTRWGHVNENYSLLTRMQAFGLDAHFSVEQTGRNFAHSFINFNGTAGIWRKETIIDAGGWSADTLTEDLDLSYRAQLKGWKFRFMEEVISPAELPVVMSAIKSQQYRWNKGAAETAKKNLGKVLSSKLSISNKIHALFHLLNSSIFILILTSALLSVPMLFIKAYYLDLKFIFQLGSIFLIGMLSITIYYWIANKATRPQQKLYFVKAFPAFLSISMGLSLHNAIAVLEGFLGFKTPFIRTPKFNVVTKKDSWENNEYIRAKINWQTMIEGALSLYFIFGFVSAFFLSDWGLLPFHLLLAIGFGSVFIYSIKPVKHA